MAASEPVCRLTGDAFLQALIECAQANLVQQTGMESLKGLHMFQTCQNYVNIFSGALCWSGEVGEKKDKVQETAEINLHMDGTLVG